MIVQSSHRGHFLLDSKDARIVLGLMGPSRGVPNFYFPEKRGEA